MSWRTGTKFALTAIVTLLTVTACIEDKKESNPSTQNYVGYWVRATDYCDYVNFEDSRCDQLKQDNYDSSPLSKSNSWRTLFINGVGGVHTYAPTWATTEDVSADVIAFIKVHKENQAYLQLQDPRLEDYVVTAFFNDGYLNIWVESDYDGKHNVPYLKVTVDEADAIESLVLEGKN